VHFPDTLEVWSFGSGYGGNAILAKKCFALRIASVIGRDEGWLAEHMLLIRVIDPAGRAFHVAAAFPSACGKTNLAMLRPSIPGWRVETLGDDIAWLRPATMAASGRSTPRPASSASRPGTGESTNVTAGRDAVGQHDLHERGAAPRRRRLVGGLTDEPPAELTDWEGQPLDARLRPTAAHPERALHGGAAQCPQIAEDWEAPQGVPLDVILFGGRRATNAPLVVEGDGLDARRLHGLEHLLGAHRGREGNGRRAPSATRSRCSRSAGTTWPTTSALAEGRSEAALRPGAAHLPGEWFRKGSDGRFLWPGFGDNARVIDWIIRRIDGEVGAIESPIGRLPRTEDLDLDGIDVPQADLDELFAINTESWLQEADLTEEFYRTFEGRIPAPLWAELAALRYRLKRA
jgi:phosphoenolpyruvate carboxykinase (GTP)